MSYGKLVAFAAATALFATTAAHAADLPAAPRMVQPAYDGWYLRGDIGMTNQQVKTLDNVLFATTANLVIHDKNFEAGMLFGLGAGYRMNNWLRFDVTGEYRGETGFHGFDTWNDGINARFNNYTAKKSEWLVLANAYIDLGTWWRVTPFVGAGVGWSQVRIHSFRDAGTTGGGTGIPTMAYADAASKSNFAWALHGGLAYEVTRSFTIELAYRYVNLGDGITGDIIAFDGSNTVVNPMHFKTITSHDVKFGVRWMLDAEPAYAPLMTRG